FTKLDLHSAYNLIHIRKGDEWKTTLVTPSRHYEYRVMPYGLSNFQNYMNEIFRDMLNQFVIIYIDDILIYSLNLEEHHHHITQVLERLLQLYLFLKGEKCELHKTTVHFLGHVITLEGVQMDQGKVDVIQNWPQPTTVKEMQGFLEFANFYSHFIANFSQVSTPLTSLLRKKPKTLTWTLVALDAFQQLKTAFCTTPT
ncbi:hypothetical protein M9458_021134, partial [Cirrhinus mrigala]